MKNMFTKTGLLYLLFLGQSIVVGQPRLSRSATPDWIDTSPRATGQVDKRSITKGYFIDLYDYQVQAEQKAHYSHIIREIVSEAGIQSAAEIWISFNPSYEKLKLHQVIVWRNGKAMDRLDADKFKVVADEDEAVDSLLISPKRKLNIQAMNGARAPVKSNRQGLDKYVWQDHRVPAAEYEPREPSWYNSYRHVQLRDLDTLYAAILTR